MSTAYQFRKVYVDLVTPDGDVLVVYLNYVCLAGVWTNRGSVEWYPRDGVRSLAHSLAPPPLVDRDTPVDALPLSMDLDDGPFELRLAPVLSGWVPDPPVLDLHWRVRAARTRASVAWAGRTLEGIGYVDYVEIQRPTRMLHLGHLTWGRVHLPARTIVFENLDTQAGRSWNDGIDWAVHAVSPTMLDGTAWVAADGHGSLQTRHGLLRLVPDRVLHDGNAFAPDRVPRALDRAACELLGGATFETRFLGQGRLGDQVGPALYERVSFGRAVSAHKATSAAIRSS